MKDGSIKEIKKQEVCKEEDVRRIVLPSGEVVVNLKADFLEMGISCGLQALEAMFKEDVEALCGPRYKHQEEKGCFRWGRTSGEVTVGGRKLKVSRPRVRDEEEEVSLPTYEYFKDDDPLKERVLTQILVGVSTRRYGGSLERGEADIPSRETSKSSVSRRFVAMTMKRLVEWMNRSLERLDSLLFID
jgi:hypothetical protein